MRSQVAFVALILAGLAATAVNGQQQDSSPAVAGQQQGGMGTFQVPGAVSGASVSAPVQLPSFSQFGVIIHEPSAPAIGGLVPGAAGVQPGWYVEWPTGRVPFPAAEAPAGVGLQEFGQQRAAGRVVGQAPGFARPGTQRRDVKRAELMVTLGDRFFKKRDLRRATERYEQAMDADILSTSARLRLSLVALARGEHSEAVEWLREIHGIDPRWHRTRPFDVQALYPEPGDFAGLIERLQEHLQAYPDDRDGWLMLGVILKLSGREEPARDIFTRLSGPAPDAVVASLLEAASEAGPSEIQRQE